MRAFIAIDLPTNIKNKLSKIQDKLKDNFAQINWVKPQNLHLTLKFLGEITSEQSSAINRIIAEISQTIIPFKIKLDDLGAFPNLHNPRIIWVGISQDVYAQQIAELLETKIADIGIAKGSHPFAAHITIGRIKSPILGSDLENELRKIKENLVEWINNRDSEGNKIEAAIRIIDAFKNKSIFSKCMNRVDYIPNL